MPGILLTDLYELRMAASYIRHREERMATFSLSMRGLPRDRGFLVAAGLEDCLTFLEGLGADPDDVEYLQGVLGFNLVDAQALGHLRFTGDVWAVPEGRVVFADEPILEVTAPIAEAQVVETYLLNRVTFQTALATKAARCRLAAGWRRLIEFGFRRTQGVDAAMAAARAAAIAGFEATSNVEAARRYGLVAAGTMAHSYIQAFDSEIEAFRAFAADFPDHPTFLVDTFDTERGVAAAARVAGELGLGDAFSVRLDSGDLDGLSRRARAILDECGCPKAEVVVTGGLDETDIDALVRAGAPVDAFGVGTRLGVCADTPFLDSAYKLVSYGDRPVIKLSPGKLTLPGAKQVYRNLRLGGDVLALRQQHLPGREALLRPVMIGGRRTTDPDTVPAMRARLDADLRALPATALRLRDPSPLPVLRSRELDRLLDRCIAQSRSRMNGALPVG